MQWADEASSLREHGVLHGWCCISMARWWLSGVAELQVYAI